MISFSFIQSLNLCFKCLVCIFVKEEIHENSINTTVFFLFSLASGFSILIVIGIFPVKDIKCIQTKKQMKVGSSCVVINRVKCLL